MGRTIVKVRLSPLDPERAIVHDRAQKYVLNVPATPPLRARLGKLQVAYFKADIGFGAVDLLELVADEKW